MQVQHAGSACRLRLRVRDRVDVGVRVGQSSGHQLEADTIERAFRCGELVDDLAAFGLLANETLQTANLPLESGQTFEHVIGGFRRKMHVLTIPLRVGVAWPTKCTYN